MSSCPSGMDDAAYVLGALSPRERLEYERHLASCPECTAAVRDLAGLPGLLGRIDPGVVEEVTEEAPLPETLLPTLHREVRATASRRNRRTALLAAAAVVMAIGLTTGVAALVDDGAPPAGVSAPSESASTGGGGQADGYREMAPLGEVPVRASVALRSEPWGTRLLLDCSYDADTVDFDLPRRVDYYLIVRDERGRAERIGSWESVDGTSMSTSAGTALPVSDISSVEVQAPGGLVVLQLVL